MPGHGDQARSRLPGAPGRLNAPDETFANQKTERVVHRLKRDRPNFAPDDLRHAVGRDVRLTRHRPKDSQSLRSDLNTALTKEISRVGGHASTA